MMYQGVSQHLLKDFLMTLSRMIQVFSMEKWMALMLKCLLMDTSGKEL